ncbi:MAG: GNAT family N-acetyltransferase [Deltaproteobacteria bacterium]|nr:GNAT family N-acetyltransferase [Deltaproteobacteria bacterium]
MSGSHWMIRAARAAELGRIGEIEREAGARFDGIPALVGLSEVVTPGAALAAALTRGQLWVAAAAADDVSVGFACADPLDDALHLVELDVLPAWSRRGIGRALVETVVDAARAVRLGAVTLTTFRDVPWNAPYYATLGFRALAPRELGPELAELVAAEDRRGLPMRLRVAMRREVRAVPTIG